MELPSFNLPYLDPAQSRSVLLTLIVLPTLLLLRAAVVAVVRAVFAHHANGRRVFWTRQGAAVGTLILVLFALSTIWFESPARITTILGFASAGLAFALQRAITAFVGYLIILRGKTFTVGDRISMGGVRGDVIDLGFLQTRIMEMGAPKDVQGDLPTWVRDRQYTGRIVTVTNDKVFEDPVFNYTREFPYMWEELCVPLSKPAHREQVEQIMIEAATAKTAEQAQSATAAMARFERRYVLHVDSIAPQVYYQFNGGKLELTLRFVVSIHNERAIKDAVKREIIARLEAANLQVHGKIA